MDELKYYTLIGLDNQLDRFVIYFHKYNYTTYDAPIYYLYKWLCDTNDTKIWSPDTYEVSSIDRILTLHTKQVILTTDSKDELLEKVKELYCLNELGE